MIYIYSLVGCPFSEASENLVIQLKIPNKIIKVRTEIEKNKYKKLHNMQTFPQIFFENSKGNIIKIGGYQEFKSIIEELCRR
jgi:glutaredoxin